MPIRKSTRSRTRSYKAADMKQQKTNPLEATAKRSKSDSQALPNNKRQKTDNVLRDNVIMSVDSNKIDPVEKLLSLTNINNDFLMSLDVCEEQQDNSMVESNELTSLNFTKILNDSIRSYYANAKRSPMSIYNDNFGLLNRSKGDVTPNYSKDSQSTTSAFTHNPSVPFFKNVNFNSVPSSSNFEEYFSYDDEETNTKVETSESEESEVESEVLASNVEDEEDPKSTVPARITPRKVATQEITVLPTPLIPTSKMSFHYRHNHNNLNLSARSCNTDSAPHDLFKILNKRSILTGKASEMVNNGGFLINDFFL